MTKLQFTLLGTAIALGLATTLFVQRRNEAQFQRNDAVLEAQASRTAALMAEQARLAAAASERKPDPAPELAKLREQEKALRTQLAELSRAKPENGRAALTPAAEPVAPRPPEYYARLHQLAGAKTRDALTLGTVARDYADEHNGQFPTSVDQLTPYLLKEKASLSGTNEFELIYQGSLEALAKVPGSAVAWLRDRHTWLAPSGKPARVYGLVNGAVQIVESDDDFRSWEATHVVRPAAAK